MARPTKFTPEVAARLLDVISSGCGREVAARQAKIGRRTLVTWLTKGRAGEVAYASFAAQVDAAEEGHRVRRVRLTHLRVAARWREGYPAWKARRIAWWRDKLGEEGFRAARLRWLREHGRHAAADRLEASIETAGSPRPEHEQP